jgi:hypothetical protein
MCLRDMPTYSLLTPSNAGENRSRIGDHGGRKQQWARRCTGEKAAASRRRVRTPRLHPAMRMWSRCGVHGAAVYIEPAHERAHRPTSARRAHKRAQRIRPPCSLARHASVTNP